VYLVGFTIEEHVRLFIIPRPAYFVTFLIIQPQQYSEE